MCSGPTLLLLLCSLICVSNGAPPRQVEKMSRFGIPYTEEEDQLIVDELSNILDGTVKPQSKAVWDKIEEKHNEKLNQGTAGFLQKRTGAALRIHFRALVYNEGSSTVKIPDTLIQKFKEGVASSSSNQPRTSNGQAGLQVQVTNEGEGDNEWIADMIEELQNNTDYEVDLSKLE